MKERPILFSAPMIHALLAGQKTQTRRVIKPQPVRLNSAQYEWKGEMANIHGEPATFWKCPYGVPGDRLWVRETFSGCNWQAPGKRYVVLKDGTQVYESGERFPGLKKYAPGAFDHINWKPSIHIPRWASRMTLDVTGVRAQRLQDISEEDARAEGAINWWLDLPQKQRPYLPDSTAKTCFHALWNSINSAPKPVLGDNGKVASYVSYPWQDVRETRQHRGKAWLVIGNPFVWAVEFPPVGKESAR